MYPSPKSVSPAADFVIVIEFTDGAIGHLDMKPFLDFGVFRNIQDPQVFNQVRIAFDSIEWPNGIDLDPEFVYAKSKLIERLT